ncbi:MAG TPA: hypothetical protein VMM14_09420, partial [Acidimicrobiia bacterium]|nr:hypothetical protein [Acidimicrobiia bacterium]
LVGIGEEPPADTVVPNTTTIPVDATSLTFTQVDPPNDETLIEGFEVRGAFHAVSWNRNVWTTSDGIDWQLLGEVPPPPFAPAARDIDSDGTRLAVVEAVGQAGPTGAECVGDEGALHLSVLESDGSWSTGSIPLQLDEVSEVGCLYVIETRITVGPQGYMVTAVLAADLRLENILARELDMSFDAVSEGLRELRQDGWMLEVVIDGERHTLDLEDLGYADDISRFTGQADELSPVDSDDLISMGEGDLAWWSPDGETWHQADPTGPLQARGMSASLAPLATGDGFLVTSLDGSRSSVWTNSDGSWNQVGTIGSRGVEPVRWGEGVLLVGDGVWYFDGNEIEILSDEIDLSEHSVSSGSWGVVAAPLFSDGPVYFSTDGRRWVELGTESFNDSNEPGLQLVGLGDQFVVLLQHMGWGETGPRPLWIGR